ncbi:helix-turn-helix domain-containing protein [Alicyclobacillus fodiniaquatilis]|uniref:Helix-turn-helix domain-containing protein n=1 Tax=Alicyclobacillus fodiniaquatilis TaxID=1661150 RepID=A0ABW4JDF0_9BACL
MMGKRIRQLRMERGLSLSSLARQANIAKSYLSAIERGIQANPSIHIMERISFALEVPIQTLIENGTNVQKSGD